MNVYTTSKLARDAGVSIHIVRDYEVRGLLRVAGRTEVRLLHLRPRRARSPALRPGGAQAGIALADLVELCRAIDGRDTHRRTDCIARMKEQIDARRKVLAGFEAQLDGLTCAVSLAAAVAEV